MKVSGKTRWGALASRVSVLCIAASMMVPQPVFAEEFTPADQSEEMEETSTLSQEPEPSGDPQPFDTEDAQSYDSADARTEDEAQADAADEDDENTRKVTLKRIVEFRDADTNESLKDPVTQTITFKLEKGTDENGDETWEATNSPQTFPAVKAPEIEGYQAE